ncbi:glycosyltransferase family 2 protein [Mucilaginibacter sp. HMF5004]|uniref:glycosyltransferase family 2 protein n=1 Tax=Mucilaginibacter rivuli TaxID=2857527 RepID=UPI001C5EA80D|nr:glycosyltransferase family 2 protein [Mucilaginibacter rivuli]MBW4890161.1 glycosyltransferase family 2 protein [Mucilaginibacter rivuli]
MQQVAIAVLLTTFNRRDKTIACLKSLKGQVTTVPVAIDIYVTDDASADGTPEAIKVIYPEANVFIGSGSLFWAGGMRKSWGEAVKGNYDYYFLLNDDTILTSNVLEVLLSYYKNKATGIVVGSTAEDGKLSYGGRVITSKLNFKKEMVFSNTEFLNCDLGNANIMLVPKGVVDKIGILSDKYTHGIADYDYTLTAVEAGINVMVAPGILGTCSDDHGNNWKSANTTLKERIKYLKSPKGLAYNEYLYLIKKHLPQHYPVAFVKLWAKTLFPFLWDRFKN